MSDLEPLVELLDWVIAIGVIYWILRPTGFQREQFELRRDALAVQRSISTSLAALARASGQLR